MIIKEGDVKRIRCPDCKRVKNATLIHVKKGRTKRSHGLNITRVDTFTLQYILEKHQRGTLDCIGSNKVKSQQYDGEIDIVF
jgi:hypothetical protein